MKISLMKVMAVFVLAPLGIAGQAAEDWTPRLTEHGQPDMQGIWFYGSSTPYERSLAL